MLVFYCLIDIDSSVLMFLEDTELRLLLTLCETRTREDKSLPKLWETKHLGITWRFEIRKECSTEKEAG